jgi:hypothetical protein
MNVKFFREINTLVTREFTTSSFSVIFKQNTFNEFIRKRQFDIIDVISSVGGIFGLLAGFSLLSFIEIFYWATLRILSTKTKMKNSKVFPVQRNEISQDQKLKIFIRNYLEESSIHSFYYIATAKWVDKIFWIITFTVSMYFCGKLCIEVEEKVPNSRVVALEDSFSFEGNVSNG